VAPLVDHNPESPAVVRNLVESRTVRDAAASSGDRCAPAALDNGKLHRYLSSTLSQRVLTNLIAIEEGFQ
jgi:hypothetical protein